MFVNDCWRNLPKALTEEETNHYLQLAHAGDEAAKNKLKEHNLRFIVYLIYKKFIDNIGSDSTFDMDDLIAVGSYGLIKAVDTFDIERNVKFATYSSKCITNEIQMFLNKNKKNKQDMSLYTLVTVEDGIETILLDTLISSDDVEENYLRMELYQTVKESLKILTDFERTIVILRYGFEGEGLTHTEIAKRFGYSQSYISKKDKEAREKIRTYLENPNAFKSLMIAPKEMETPVFPITEKDIYSLFPNFSRMEIDEVIREFGQRGRILSNLKVDVCENGKPYLEQISLRAAKSQNEIEIGVASILQKISGQLTARGIKNKEKNNHVEPIAYDNNHREIISAPVKKIVFLLNSQDDCSYSSIEEQIKKIISSEGLETYKIMIRALTNIAVTFSKGFNKNKSSKPLNLNKHR